MSDNKEEKPRKTLALNRPKKLELRTTVETGQVKQSFSHGRSRNVTVEVKRSRTFAPGKDGRMAEVSKKASEDQAQDEALKEAFVDTSSETSRLTEEERLAREQALAKSLSEEPSRRAQAEEEARRREEAKIRFEEEQNSRRSEDEKAQELRRKREEEEQKRLEMERVAAQQAAVPDPEAIERGAAVVDRSAKAKRPVEDEEESARGKKRVPGVTRTPSPKRDGDARRRAGRLTLSQALSDGGERQRSLASVKRQREKQKQIERGKNEPPKKVLRDVILPETITVQELANRMAERGVDVVKTLMKLGVMATINQVIDADTAELVAAEMGHKIKRVSAADVLEGLGGDDDSNKDLKPRAPVVTVMGHVDHGKTSLLDALRETDVAAHEAGGITQHIGACQIRLASGQSITFVDTPGHAAFTEMRARGADVTDIVVLVVAADDGIMEQTAEAISHARAANVPIIVAINKMDKPEANAARVKQDLLRHDLVVEDMGGDILAVEVSAKAKTGLDKLEEAILLQAEVLELKANAERSAKGVVIEAKLERGLGSVATVLVQTGTLKVGDIFVTGAEWGRVRGLSNERGERLESAGPSIPVEVQGLNGVPLSGDDFVVVENEARAREVAEYRAQVSKDKQLALSQRGSIEDMMKGIKEGEADQLPVVIKSDVHGSTEAIIGALERLSTDEVKVRILHSGVGAVNESDTTLAAASRALIIAFNVRANPQARDMAKRDHVDIRYYSIIYNVIDDVKAALSGMLSPEAREKFLGYAEIREVFDNSKAGKVAGCMITEGLVKRGSKVRLLRDNVVIHDGALKTLRRFKDEVKEVREGFECGMAFENYTDIQVGDQIECYEVEEIARAL